MTTLFTRIKNLFRKSAVDRALDAELSSHLQLHMEDNLAKGMSPEAARKDAMLKLGGLEQTKESMRDQQSLPILESLLADARFALRLLKKSPAFTCVALLTLALGIGANTAIFSVMRQVLLKRLPLPRPEQLVLLYSPGPREGHVSSDEGDGSVSFSYPMYLDLRDQNTVFSGLSAIAYFPISLSLRGQTEHADSEIISGNFFSTLGVRPALGRLIEPDDTRAPGTKPVVVLTYAYWQKRFGGDRSLLNQTILVNDRPMTVIGVVEKDFDGIQPGSLNDVYLPITMRPVIEPDSEGRRHAGLMDRNDFWAKLIGRLKPGVTREQATASLAPLYHGFLQDELPLNKGMSKQEQKEFAARQIILKDGSRGRPILANETRRELLTLMGMVGLVLFITCANLAGLLTARGAVRQKEIGVRFSLGASRWRLIRQLVLESCLLSLGGAVLGLILAHWLAAALVAYAASNDVAHGLSSSLHPSVLVFTISLALFCGILFGVAPAWNATKVQFATVLKSQSSSLSSSLAQVGLRRALVISQFALTLILVTGAWGFVCSLYHLKNIDLGYHPDHIFQFSIAPRLNGYDLERSFALCAQLEQRFASLPGVVSVGLAERRLMHGGSWTSNVRLEGYSDTPDVGRNSVNPGYFSNFGIPLVAGREFTLADDAQAPKVAIVNETLARRYFPNGQAVGKRMAFNGGSAPFDTEIVGVVRDVHEQDVQEQPYPLAYMPYRQRATLSAMTFYVRTASAPTAIAGAIRSTVGEVDSALPIYDARTFEEQIDSRLSSERLLAILALAFGSLAAILAAMGVYALLAYTVSQRNREIGVRMALGAEPGSVALMVLRDVAILSALGVGIGIPLAYAASRFLNSMLYNVRSFDVVSLCISLLVLGSVAGLAAWLPARRAARIDPIIALRYE